eukprot:comp7102_c0_seq1/m.2829 comp7102_c0_seq1/g.2829  ORF comp7102_c0_seq1/g.2829 comp7102_c0_seq1/m.2829 type:complete len:550 (-) comp7102_c0_seq1:270-1919(-)
MGAKRSIRLFSSCLTLSHLLFFLCAAPLVHINTTHIYLYTRPHSPTKPLLSTFSLPNTLQSMLTEQTTQKNARQVPFSFPFNDPPVTHPNPSIPLRSRYVYPHLIRKIRTSPGEAAVVKCGVYNNTGPMRIRRGGESLEKMLIVKAETPGCVIFTGDSTFVVRANFVEIQGFVFYGTKNLTYPAIQLYANTTGCRVIQCTFDSFHPSNLFPSLKQTTIDIWGDGHRIEWNTFKNMNHLGEMVRVRSKIPGSVEMDSKNHVISYNYFGPRVQLGANGGEIIQVGLSNPKHKTNITVSFNVFDRISSDAETVSVKASSNYIKYNTVYGGTGMISVRTGSRNFILGNYIFCNGQEGCSGLRTASKQNTIAENYIDGERSVANKVHGSISVLGGNLHTRGRSPATKTKILRNLAVDCTWCLGLGLGFDNPDDLPIAKTEITNNTFVGRSKDSLLIRLGTAGDNKTKISGNFFLQGTISPSDHRYIELLQHANVGNPVLSEYTMGVRIPEGVPISSLPSFSYRPLLRTEVGAGYLFVPPPTLVRVQPALPIANQ